MQSLNSQSPGFSRHSGGSGGQETVASIAAALIDAQRLQVIPFVNTHAPIYPTWLYFDAEQEATLRQMDPMMFPREELDMRKSWEMGNQLRNACSQFTVIMNCAARADFKSAIVARVQTALLSFGWPTPVSAFAFCALVTQFQCSTSLHEPCVRSLLTQLAIIETIAKAEREDRLNFLSSFFAGLSCAFAGNCAVFAAFRREWSIVAGRDAASVRGFYVVRPAFYAPEHSGALSQAALRTSVAPAVSASNLSRDSDTSSHGESCNADSPCEDDAPVRAHDAPTAARQSQPASFPPQRSSVARKDDDVTVDVPLPIAARRAFVEGLRNELGGATKRWIAVRWAHADHPDDVAVWVGEICPFKKDARMFAVEYAFVLAPDNTVTRLADDDGDAATFTGSILADDVLFFAVEVYNGARPQPGETIPSRLARPAFAKLFPAEYAASLPKVNPCAKCGQSVPTFPRDSCTACASPLHVGCRDAALKCPRCATAAAPLPPQIPPPSAPPAAAAQPGGEAEEEDDTHDDDVDEILAAPRHPKARLPEDLPPRRGVMGPVKTDKKGASYTFLTSDENPTRVFLHRNNAGGVPLKEGTKVIFTPTANPLRPGSFMAIVIRRDTEEDFPAGQPAPELVRITKGADFAALTLQQPPPEINEAVELPTQEARLRIARLVQDKIRALHFLQQAHISIACIRALYKIKAEHNWKWSTMQTAMGLLTGVLSCLDAYTRAHPYKLSEMGSWRLATRRVTKQTHLEEVKQSAPATIDDIRKAAQLLNKAPRAKLLLILAWSHAARASNVMTLQPQWFSTDNTIITWKKAKTTAKRGPYSTSSSYGEFTEFVRTEIAAYTDRAAPMFNKDDLTQVRTALRSLNKDFDLRSFRRGALQALATQGIPIATLMQFSGHTTERSLLRYLNWGQKYGEAYNRGTTAAKAFLWPTSS